MQIHNFLFKADLLQKSTRILTGCISILLFFTVSTFSLISRIAAESFTRNFQSNLEKTVKYKTYLNSSIPCSEIPEIYENTSEYAEELEEVCVGLGCEHVGEDGWWQYHTSQTFEQLADVICP